MSLIGSQGGLIGASGVAGGPATLTGTPVAWTSGNITVPSDCNDIYMFWSYFVGAGGGGIASASIGSAAADSLSVKTSIGGYISGGLVVWYEPPTGSQTVSITLSTIVNFDIGPTIIFVFVRDSDTSGFRDADAASYSTHSVTIDSAASDLVIKAATLSAGGTIPAAGTGWTSQQTQEGTGGLSARVSTADSPGSATTTANNEVTGDYATIVAVSVKGR
jgi:hypothetical protein